MLDPAENHLKLYSYWRSSSAYRVRIMMNLKQVTYDCIPVNLLKQEQRSDWYSKINPNLTVPALQLPDGTVLTQSNAILEYLEEEYPTILTLPTSSVERARVRAVVDVVCSDIQPVQNMRVLNKLHPDQSKADWARDVITSGFQAIDQLLPGGNTYCFGDSITMADVVLVPQVYNAIRFHVDMSQFPKISSINQELIKLKAFQDAHPSVQVDAVQ